jgi:hypothetical protein
MKSSFRFSQHDRRAGLVIVFPLGVSGLFNPEIHGLVKEVEEHLDGVFVTYALSSGESPQLRDAISAARFAGCQSTVVVYAADSDAALPAKQTPRGDWLLASIPVRSELDASIVVGAYHNALEAAGMAA